MDSRDKRIIELLTADARMSYTDIGKELGISRVAAKKRVMTLEEQGFISGYRVIMGAGNLKKSVVYHLDVNTTPERYDEIIAKFAALEDVESVYKTSGDCRFHAVCRSEDVATMEHVVNELFEGTDGIVKMGWHRVLEQVK